jgi:putative tricarboxylic transport membrane protein
MSERAGELLVSLAILALGIAFAAGAWLLPEAPGYARVSARLFPALISAGLIAAGLLLLKETLAGGFRELPGEQREPLNVRGFLWVSAGVVAHMALIAGIGFVLASALLYAAAARGFGSARPLRDAAVGVVLGAAVYTVFTYGLTLSLPWGAWIPGGPA